MARRRRAPRVVWLPQTNANTIDGVNANSAFQTTILQVAGDPGDSAGGVIPLTIDGGESDPLALSTSLADVENSGYRLRRIVGKIWCTTEQVTGGSGPQAGILCAGIIVLRADVATGIPIAGATSTDYDPAKIQNAGDPWCWRRSWMCVNSGATAVGTDFFGPRLFTGCNWSVGGNADGPHVDQKTARIVSSEERLFLALSLTLITSGVDAQSTLDVKVFTDLRLLASMRTGIGNRRNASR